MKNTKHTLDKKLECILLYNEGYSLFEIGKKLEIDDALALNWVERYKAYGIVGLKRLKQIRFTGEQKIAIVRDLLENNLNYHEAATKYKANGPTIHRWKQKVLASGYNVLADVPIPETPSSVVEVHNEHQLPDEIINLQNDIMGLKKEIEQLMQKA